MGLVGTLFSAVVVCKFKLNIKRKLKLIRNNKKKLFK